MNNLILRNTKKKLILPLIVLFLLGVGTIATFILVKSNQDIRQQASGGCSVGDPYCSCDIWDSNCVEVDKDGPRDIVEKGGELQLKGVLSTSYSGDRATSESSCGGVWQNDFCYMPGDELTGGYIVVESGRYNYPYFEKKETYESISYGAETVTGNMGSTDRLGEDCGGKGLAVDGICFTYGSTINGYLVMPGRDSDCNNNEGDYCYAHLKKIETKYDDWQSAVEAYESTGDYSKLEQLYQDTYGIPFAVGGLFDPNSGNAEILTAQTLMAALTDASVLQVRAAAQNAALDEKIKNGEELTKAEQDSYNFNRDIVADENFDKRYFYLDQLSAATVQQTTFNKAISDMYRELVLAGDSEELSSVVLEKFREIYGYDPAEKYGKIDGILKTIGIDPTKLAEDRAIYQQQLAAKEQAEREQAALEKAIEEQVAQEEQAAQVAQDISGLASSNQADPAYKETLRDLYEIYTGNRAPYQMTVDELSKEISKHSSQFALQTYLTTGDISYLQENYVSGRSFAEISNSGILNDEKALIVSMVGREDGSEIYNSLVLPTLVNDAINGFAQDPSQLESVCASALGSSCNISSENASEMLGQLLEIVYEGTDANIAEMTVAYSNQLLAAAEQVKDESAWDRLGAMYYASQVSNAYGASAMFSESAQEAIGDAYDVYDEAQANYELALVAAQTFDAQTTFEYANQVAVKAELSDYTWGTTLGNAVMYDNVFDREYDLQDDLGLSGLDAFGMSWNQVETQVFNVTNNVENIATNYAIAVQSGYTGPANTNVADLALQSAQNLGVLDFDYQEAQTGHYFKQGVSNVGATITDWAVTAGTYTALAIESVPPISSPYASAYYAGSTPTTVDYADVDYADIADQAREAGDAAAAAIRQDSMESLVEQHNQNVETDADKIDLDQYISFQTDEEIVRSRQELSWETVEKVVAPVAAIVVLPVAVASGAGLGVIAGVASGSFSLYQGAGAKAQALELERVIISEDIDNRKNAQVLTTLNAQGITYEDPEYEAAYQETMVAVDEQVKMLNKQGNIMIASSAVATLTSGAGIINGFNTGAQAAIAVGGTVARSTQIAMNVSQTMSAVGRVGGIGLSSYNAINSGQQAIAAANTLSGIDVLVANGTMTEAEAAAKRGELKGQIAMSGLSSFVAASGVVGNTFGFIRNPSLQTQAITTRTDLILDVMNVPAGVAVDAQNVSQSCFNSSYPSGEDDCRDAWIGLALSLTQDVAQVRNSTSSFKNYQHEQLTNLSLTGDYAQRISLLDQRMLGLMENDNRTMSANLELLDLRSYRQQLSLEASRLNTGLVIPELVRISNITSIDTQKITDVSRQNYESLVKRASEVKISDGELAAKLVKQAGDSWSHQQDILKIYGEVADIDRQINQDSGRMSDLEIESLRGKRGGLVDDLESRVNNQPFKTANLDQDNSQLLASARVNEALKTYDSARLAEDQAVDLERLNLPPPDDDSPKKRTGLALLIPGSAEQNKALDLATLQTRLHEIDSLDLQRTQIEQDLEAVRQIDANDPLVKSLETELVSIDQKIVDANKIVDQVTPSNIGGEPSFWQRLTSSFPSQKTAQDYDQAMLAVREMSHLRQEKVTIAAEISSISNKSRLSGSDQVRVNDLSARLEVIDQEYIKMGGLVKGVSDRAKTALDPQTNRIAAFFSGSLESLRKILPSRNQNIGDVQQDFDTKYQVTKENIAQRAEGVAVIKDQLVAAKNSYDELTRSQSEVKKSDSEITRLNQELIDLEKQSGPLSAEQAARKTEIPGEIAAIEDVKKIITNSINRLEEQLLQPILSADVAQKLTQAQKDGDFDEVLGGIRTDELSRLADNEIGLSSRQDSIVEDLLKIKSSIADSSSAEDLILQRDLYNQKLSELNESILGSSPEVADYQRLSSAQQFLKNMDVLTAARSARAAGDDDGAISILSSREASIPVEDPVLAARLETIIRDAEFRTGASEGIEFFNSRSNQMDTYLKILQGERVAIELTTAGGKTFVGSILLKTQVEILGYDTGIYIAKPGQEADIQRSMMKAYGVGEEKVVVLDSSRLSEPDYVSSLLASRFVVADPSNLQFIRNSANNFDDPNFKTANDVYKKLTENTSLYIDELQINLDPSRQAINSVGASGEDIPDAYKDSARLVGEALDETLLKNGGWGLGDNDFLVLKTSEGAEVAKFSQSAQKDIFTALANKMGVSVADYDLVKNNAPELERALSQDVEILKQKLATLGVKLSPSDTEKIFDQIDMVNTFAQGLKMKNGTDYQRMKDSVLANNGGLERPVTVPAAGAVANEGQSYAAKLQVAMEYIGARANNETPNFKGLTSSPNLAYKSTIADYLGDLKGSSVGAVTGALADGRGVAETALGLVTYRSTEAVEKILSIEGSSTGERINVERSYQINRDGDADALVALKLAGKLDQSTGEDAKGNLKIVMGFDGAKNPLDFAVEMAKSGAFDQAEFAVQNPDGSYSLVKIDSSGETVSSRDIDAKAIQDLYNDKNNPAQNLITIIGRGGATGDSIKTARNIPGVTITSFDAPEGLVAQAGARIDRGSDIADQYALIINRNATRLNIDNPVDFLKIAQMTESDFVAFRNQVTAVQKTVEQAKNTQALDQGVVAASTRVLSDLIRNSTVPEIQKWASSKLLDFYAEETQRDLSLDGGAQESLSARQKKILAQVDSWERLFTDKSNKNVLDTIEKLHPELYEQMRSNVYASDQKLAYAETEVGSKESVMTAANLSEFVDRHNKYVVADSENKYVADSGRSPIVDQIATNTQKNSVASNNAKARIDQVVDLVKGLRNISISISNPLKAIPGLIDQAKASNFSQNLARLPKNLPLWVPDIKEVKENGLLIYEKRLADLEALSEKLANTKDRIAQADIVEKIGRAKTALGESRFAAFTTRVNLAFRNRSKLAEQSEGDVQEGEVGSDEGTLVEDIGFALGRAWRRRGDETGKLAADETTLANDIGFSLAKAWNKRKNRIAEGKANLDGRTRVEAFRFTLGRAWATRMIPGISIIGDGIATLFKENPEVIDKREQVIASLKITNPLMLVSLRLANSTEKLDEFVVTRKLTYELLQNQFSSLNTRRPGVKNEEEYRAQAQRLGDIVSEIEKLQQDSKLVFAEADGDKLKTGEDGLFIRANQDRYKSLSEFSQSATKEIARLDKESLEAEEKFNAEKQTASDQDQYITISISSGAQQYFDLDGKRLPQANILAEVQAQLTQLQDPDLDGETVIINYQTDEGISQQMGFRIADNKLYPTRFRNQSDSDKFGITHKPLLEGKTIELWDKVGRLGEIDIASFDGQEAVFVNLPRLGYLELGAQADQYIIVHNEDGSSERYDDVESLGFARGSFTPVDNIANLENILNENREEGAARLQEVYQQLTNQFLALGANVSKIDNLDIYQSEKMRLGDLITRIDTLEHESGLKFLDLGEDFWASDEYEIVRIDKTKNLAAFIAELSESGFKEDADKLMALNGEQVDGGDLAQKEEIFSLGRRSSNDFVSQIDEVSRNHAKIFRGVGGALYIRDLESSFGTYVNGQRIESNKDVVLKKGDYIVLGNPETSTADLAVIEENGELSITGVSGIASEIDRQRQALKAEETEKQRLSGNEYISRVKDGGDVFINKSDRDIQLLDPLTGKTTQLKKKGFIVLTKNYLVEVSSENSDEQKWFMINEDGSTKNFSIKPSTETADELISQQTEGNWSDGSTMFDSTKIGEVHSVDIIGDHGEIITTMHFSEHFEVHKDVNSLFGSLFSSRESKLNKYASYMAWAMFRAEGILGKENSVREEVLLVSEEAVSRSYESGGNFIASFDKDESLREIMGTIAHEHTHAVLDGSPIRDFEEGLAMYVEQKVSEYKDSEFGRRSSGFAAVESYSQVARLIGGGKLSATQFNAISQHSGLLGAYEWTYFSGYFLVRSILETQGVDAFSKFLNLHQASSLRYNLSDHDLNLSRVSTGASIHNYEAINEMLGEFFGSEQVEVILNKSKELMETIPFNQVMDKVEDVIYLGRDSENDYQGKNTSVSRIHAIVGKDVLGSLFLTDLNSLNGTFVNGVRIDQNHRLKEGDEIRLGEQKGEASVLRVVSRKETNEHGIEISVFELVPVSGINKSNAKTLENQRMEELEKVHAEVLEGIGDLSILLPQSLTLSQLEIALDRARALFKLTAENDFSAMNQNNVSLTQVLGSLSQSLYEAFKDKGGGEAPFYGRGGANEIDRSSFNNLCSSCTEVRDQTKAGLKVAEELLAVGETDQALAQLDRTRKEVVNEHGMQNQCVQLYLNAWVDTREAEIKQNNGDTNKAIASVYRATIIAEELLETSRMEVVDRRGFLGIGRKSEVLGLVSEDIVDIKNMLDGNDDIPGLRQMAEFERDGGGKLNQSKTIGGRLHSPEEAAPKKSSPSIIQRIQTLVSKPFKIVAQSFLRARLGVNRDSVIGQIYRIGNKYYQLSENDGSVEVIPVAGFKNEYQVGINFHSRIINGLIISYDKKTETFSVESENGVKTTLTEDQIQFENGVVLGAKGDTLSYIKYGSHNLIDFGYSQNLSFDGDLYVESQPIPSDQYGGNVNALWMRNGNIQSESGTKIFPGDKLTMRGWQTLSIDQDKDGIYKIEYPPIFLSKAQEERLLELLVYKNDENLVSWIRQSLITKAGMSEDELNSATNGIYLNKEGGLDLDRYDFKKMSFYSSSSTFDAFSAVKKLAKEYMLENDSEYKELLQEALRRRTSKKIEVFDYNRQRFEIRKKYEQSNSEILSDMGEIYDVAYRMWDGVLSFDEETSSKAIEDAMKSLPESTVNQIEDVIGKISEPRISDPLTLSYISNRYELGSSLTKTKEFSNFDKAIFVEEALLRRITDRIDIASHQERMNSLWENAFEFIGQDRPDWFHTPSFRGDEFTYILMGNKEGANVLGNADRIYLDGAPSEDIGSVVDHEAMHQITNKYKPAVDNFNDDPIDQAMDHNQVEMVTEFLRQMASYQDGRINIPSKDLEPNIAYQPWVNELIDLMHQVDEKTGEGNSMKELLRGVLDYRQGSVSNSLDYLQELYDESFNAREEEGFYKQINNAIEGNLSFKRGGGNAGLAIGGDFKIIRKKQLLEWIDGFVGGTPIFKNAGVDDSLSSIVDSVKPSFEIVDKLPIDLDTLDNETRQWSEPSPNTKYLIARDEQTGDLTGFIVIDHEDKSTTADLRYKFVFSESRNKGVGSDLSLDIYEWARANSIAVIKSAINEVIRVDEQGNAEQYFDGPNGTWASYKSKIKTSYKDGSYPVYKIVAVTTSNGVITLDLETIILDENGNPISLDQPALPDNSQDLFKYLLDGVFPQGFSPKEIGENINEPLKIKTFINGDEVDYMDYLLGKIETTEPTEAFDWELPDVVSENSFPNRVSNFFKPLTNLAKRARDFFARDIDEKNGAGSIEGNLPQPDLGSVMGVREHETAPAEVEMVYENDQASAPVIAGWADNQHEALQRTLAIQNLSLPDGEINKDFITYTLPTNGRSDFILPTDPLVIGGVVFPAIQRKGVGSLRTPLGKQKEHSAAIYDRTDESTRQVEIFQSGTVSYPSLGFTGETAWKEDVRVTDEWLELGMRVRQPYSTYSLQKVYADPRFQQESIAEIRARGVDTYGNPVVSTWGTRNPFTFADVTESIKFELKVSERTPQRLKEYLGEVLKSQAYFLQFDDQQAQQIAARIQNSEVGVENDWLIWLAQTFGRQTGIKTENGLYHAELHRQNITLGAEYRDLADLEHDVWGDYGDLADDQKQTLAEEVVKTLLPIIEMQLGFNLANEVAWDTNIPNLIDEFFGELKQQSPGVARDLRRRVIAKLNSPEKIDTNQLYYFTNTFIARGGDSKFDSPLTDLSFQTYINSQIRLLSYPWLNKLSFFKKFIERQTFKESAPKERFGEARKIARQILRREGKEIFVGAIEEDMEDIGIGLLSAERLAFSSINRVLDEIDVSRWDEDDTFFIQKNRVAREIHGLVNANYIIFELMKSSFQSREEETSFLFNDLNFLKPSYSFLYS